MRFHAASTAAKKLATAATVAAVIGTALAACGGSSSSSSSSSASASNAASTGTASTSSSGSGTPFRIALIGPSSGPLAVAGASEFAGAKAAAAAINAEGGVLGHKVAIDVMDDAGTGTKAVTVGQQLLTSGTKYNAIMGGTFAQDSVPLAAVFGKTGTLDFGAVPDQLLVPPKYPNLFIAGSATSAPEVALATGMKQHGITKFAIITGGDATGQFGAQELQAAAKSLGMTVTATEFVPDTAVDATSQMQAALASNPQALAVNNYTPVIGPILKARTKLGSKLPLWGDAYFAAANLALISTPADRKGVMVEAFPFLIQGTAASKTAAFQSFLKYDTQVNPKPLISRYADMTGWDVVMMARAAAQKAGTITPSALPTALGNISSASGVPDFLGGRSLYSPRNHTWAVTPSDYDYVPAGTSPNGLIIPGT